MPNIIINNYCNQSCSYCFAMENMRDISLQKNMKLSTYIQVLKYLRQIGDNNVRILWGEPIIFPHLRRYLKLAEKWGFNTIVFSNINISPSKFQKIFQGLKQVRVNCNINDEDFYNQDEKDNIHANLAFLQSQNIKTILWYNITDLSKKPLFHVKLAERHKIQNINLKITNSSLGGSIIIDTASKDFWDYIYSFIEKYHSKFTIEFSCGLSPKVFSQKQLDFIQQVAKIDIPFGCEWHRGRFDINTDGSIFKCYPLESLYKINPPRVWALLQNKTPLQNTLNTLYEWVYSDGECSAHKIIKWLN